MTLSSRAWEIIGNYESHDLVKSAYLSRHSREPNSGLRREIASAFIQARKYYEAASAADRAIKPLLLYYGVVSLAKGLTLFLTSGLREASLKPSHGMSTMDWQGTLTQENPDLGKLKIRVNSAGTFVELVRATDNSNLNRANSSAVNQSQTLGPIPENTEVDFEGLLLRLPDIIEQTKRWKKPLCIKPAIETISGTSECIVKVAKTDVFIDEPLVMDVLGGPSYFKPVSDDANIVAMQSLREGVTSAAITDLVQANFLGIGDLYFSKQFAPNVNFSKLAQLYAISFALGMLVRYHSSFWMDLIHQRGSDVSLPSLTAAIDCIETLFPIIVSDFLEQKS